MAKLSLVLADSDEAYIGKLYDYIIRNYSARFQVSLYTEKVCLSDSISRTDKKIDILLISPELYIPSLQEEKVGTLILLTSESDRADSENCESLNKYQPADKLVNSLISVYSEKNGDTVLHTGKRKTKLIGFFSSIGGVGKTTICVSAAMMSAEMGNMVFYLNFEDVNSTTAFFKSNSNQSMSDIFYYLKEKNKNLPLKIEGVRCIDDSTGVHYFSPQDSIREMEDILSEECAELLKNFANMGYYDYVFIDLTTAFSKRNLAMLECCDSIIVVLSDDDIASIKTTAFTKEIAILEAKDNISISEKIIFLINKAQNCFDNPIEIDGEPVNINIPFIQGLTSRRLHSILKDSGSSFSAGINELLASI